MNQELTGNTTNFHRLAAFFGTSVQDNYFRIPARIGKGVVKQIEIEKGLYVRVWDICLDHPLEVGKAACLPHARRTMHITYILNPAAFEMDQPLPEQNALSKNGIHVLYDSGDHHLSFTIRGGQPVRVIAIHACMDWLIEAFTNENPQAHAFLTSISENKSSCFSYQQVPNSSHRLLQEFHDQLVNDAKPIKQKATTLLLLNDLATEFSHHQPEEAKQETILYKQEVSMVEDIMRQHFNRPLPPIRHIARQVGLSESTLKRYFHFFHGTSIYDHYLHLKMDYAKKLLSEKERSVKDIAYCLGYEKCSSFILTFKKIYHQSPGLFRQH